jgi:ACS family hexuronate transporter-like MFS transporter
VELQGLLSKAIFCSPFTDFRFQLLCQKDIFNHFDVPKMVFLVNRVKRIWLKILIPTIFTVNLYWITLLFALSTFSYAAFSTIANVLPTDLYRSDSVATVSGMSGTGAGIGTIIAFELIGHLTDARQATGTHTFDPIVIVAGLIPFIGMILVLLLVRNTRATDQGLVRRI